MKTSYLEESGDQQIQSQKRKVLNYISQNYLGCNMILSLFIAALSSYRSDRCLRPFPGYFIYNSIKDFQRLKAVCDSIPTLKELLQEPHTYSSDIYKFLTWIFLDKQYPILERVEYNENCLPGGIPETLRPHYVFSVIHPRSADELFKKRKGTKSTLLAYHGSSVENFYSILKVGLQQHFSIEKEVLFGKGIYLSSELSISTHYSPFGQTWKKSQLGSQHSLVAVCEIIDDDEKVKYFVNKNGVKPSSKVPDKYFVVTDNDMIRLKYLLVYKKNSKFSFFILLCGFLLMLLIIGLNNSRIKYKFFNYIFS